MSTGAFTLADVDKPKGQFTQADLEQSAPKEEPGMLKKAWNWINTPVADKHLPEGMKTADIVRGMAFEKLFGEPYIPGSNDFDTKAKMHLGDSPTKEALKTFIAGSAKDTSDLGAGQTSPLGIGTAIGGALTKAPGAIGTLARVFTGGVSAATTAAGAKDIYQAGTENTPEAWRQRLQGGAEVAGGAAGVKATKPVSSLAEVAGKVLPESVPKTLYKSALKPSTTLPDWKVNNILKTGIAEGIPVSASGQEKLTGLIESINNDIASKIKAGAGKGVTVKKFAVASRLGDTADTFANQVTPAKDLATVGKIGNEFLKGQPNEIPADTAQAMKQGTYQQISKSYGKLSSASIESQKALARGLKEELAAQIPEIGDLNARESQLIGLDQALERAVNRIGNHQMMGIGTPLAASGVKAATGSTGLSAAAGVLKAIVDDPIIKSKLAIAMGRKGVPVGQANARLAKYSALLGNAAKNLPPAGQTSEQGDEQ